MNGFRSLFLVLICIMFYWACEKPITIVEEGELSFSTDTLKFDSIFINFLSPSRRLIVTNNSNDNINISRVWLESGDRSEFDMIVDGLRTNDAQDVVLRKYDSLLLFINFTSFVRDDFVEEYVAFQVGDNIQRVLLRAFIVDGYLLRARLRNDSLVGFFFRQDTLLTPDKPIIMDGPIVIPEGVTVSMLPGTHIFFTPYKIRIDPVPSPPDTFTLFSQLFINGTLDARATPDAPIIFEGSRFDPDFLELPAQWRGITFSTNSRNNQLDHVLIKNAQFGIRVDSISVNAQPKVTIRHSEIRNMSAYGVWGVGFSGNLSGPPSIVMENSIVNTCKEKTLFIWGGGKYEFYNTTFANFNLIGFGRRSPQLLIQDYGEFPGQILVAPGDVQLVNCAIWGDEEDEVIVDFVGGTDFNLTFDHSLIRYSEDNEVDISQYLENTLVNQDPLFNDKNLRDYRPQLNSPVIDMGKDLRARFLDDFRGRADSLRIGAYDIGAYEFYPLE